MGVGSAGAQIQDDVKRTVALHRDQEIPGARFAGTEIQIVAVRPPREVFPPAVASRRVSQFLLVSEIMHGPQATARSTMFVGVQFHSRRLFGVPSGVSS
jgi:hypothetical protein